MQWSRVTRTGVLADSEIWCCVFDHNESESFATDNSDEVVACFVDPEVLISQATADGVTPGDLLLSEFIPDNPSIKSGDFGEITSKLVLQEWRDQPSFPVYRWRNKAYKNDTVRGFDLIGYVFQHTQDPSPDDVLVLCEVKTRSATTDPEVAEKAYNDAKKHYISHLANSLHYIRAWLRERGYETEAVRFDRFSNPHRVGFLRRLVPALVLDPLHWDDTFLDLLPALHGSTEEVYFVLIKIPNLSQFFNRLCELAAWRINNG